MILIKKLLRIFPNLYGMVADWLDEIVIKYFFTTKRVKIIKSVRFKDLFDGEITITLGQEVALSDGDNVQKMVIDGIFVKNNRIAVSAGEMTNHFETVKICNILFEDVDERSFVQSTLSKIVLRAKQLEIIPPIQANELIKQLKEQSNVD